jgi:hypothetical protein
MALVKIPFKPGFNKQITDTQAENVWVDGDNVRFRYGQPEKIGGWLQVTSDTLIGAARAQHTFTDLDGRKYAAIGTNRCLYIYYSGQFYDITPIDPDRQQTGADITTTNGSTTVTITTTAAHNLNIGDIVTFENAGSFTGGQTDYTATDFDDVLYEVKTIPTTQTFTIEMASAETGTGATNDGTLDPLPYIQIGPLVQTLGYGWGAGLWGSSTWGTPRTISNTNIDPGIWSLDNFGQNLIATVHNGRSFQWVPVSGSGAALTTRAASIANNPTKSVRTIVSDRDRHLIHLGTETTIGDPATQDKMFIRFSDQEDISDYQPTSINTAGTFRIDSGSDIRGAVKGKDYIFIGTDSAAYIMQFVGPPFTFSIRQVGSNCGVLGQNSMVFVDTTVYWMSDEGGFFVYDGSVKKLPCLVEDFVFKTTGANPGLNFNAGQQVYAAHNSLFNEIIWFYPDASSQFANRMVIYNYLEGTWVTGTLARTSYTDKVVFDKPYATKFTQNEAPSFPVVNGISSSQGKSIYYEHETGVNEVDANGNKTAIAAFIKSGDFDLDVEGEGQYFMKIRRFIPDFKNLTGNAKITLDLRDYPSETATSSPLGPFTINSSTDKVDTRARARLAALKIENESTDENWRLGLFRVDTQPDGMRG